MTNCECDSPELGFINGDEENIYCTVCELVLGRWSDLFITNGPMVRKIEVNYEG